MNSFILFVVLNLGGGQKQIMFQEFNSRETCDAALSEVAVIGFDFIERIACLPK